MPEVVYIAGTGRSGSTLLDMLLGSLPDAIGTGELAGFFANWADGGHCSCGETYPACELWGRVIERIEATFPGLSPLEAEGVTRRVESLAGSWQMGSRRASDRQFYARLWRTMIDAIGEESGKHVIVDSSKSSRATTLRIHALVHLCGFGVKVIHLIRDPRALMWSAIRGSNRRIEAGEGGTLAGGVYRMLAGWGMANVMVERTRSSNPQIGIMRLKYEDLVREPVREIDRLGSFLEQDMSPVIDLLEGQHGLETGHGVGGNRMRRQGPVRIRADEEWKEALPAHARVLAMLAWPLARRYGYDVLHVPR